jgi:uncharacterized protein
MFSTIQKSALEINQAMRRVYGYMALATIVSMLISFLVGTNQELVQFFFTGILHWVVLFAPLVAVFVLVPFVQSEPSKFAALGALCGFAALMGLSVSVIFAVYAMSSIFTAFMGAAVLFGTMSVYGLVTKRDLSGIGSFLMVGLIAIIIASVINIFVGSTVAQMAISAIAILVFLGLTAYDTQTIRDQLESDHGNSAEILGALSLYLDFINLFLNLLQLFGVAGNDD